MNKQDIQNLWILLKDIAGREKKTMLNIVIVSLVGSALPFISIIGMGVLVDSLYTGVAQNTLYQYALYIAAGIAMCSVIVARATENLEQKQDYTKDLEAKELNRKAISMDYEYLEEAHVRNLRSRAFAKSFYGI